jgi:hypothetical protein
VIAAEPLHIPAPQLPPLYPKQRAAILCPARYTIIEATTKAGKTAGCLIWILTEAWNKGQDNRNWWWVAPVIPQAKIAFRRLKRMLRQFDPSKASWNANETELRIELRNGASIWFKGSDDPDGLYGEDVYGAVIDEATRCKEESWHAVRSTLTATGGPVKIIGNVRGRKNWAFRLAQRAKAGAPNMAHFKLTAYDAVEGGILTLEEIEDAKATLPEHVFKELYLAEPSDDGGNPFGLEAIAKCVRETLSTNPIVAYGIDLAKSVDWTVLCGLDADGAVVSLDRWQSDWGQTRRRIIEIVGDTPALVDSTGVGDPIVEDLCRACPNVEGFKFSATSKQQLMEGLAAGVQQSKVGIPAGWLVGEMESFEYEYRPGGVRYSAPEGLHDDGVCGLALAFRKLGLVLGNQFQMVSDWAQAVA